MAKLWAAVFIILSLLLIANTTFAARPINDEAKATANATVHHFVDSWNRADGVAYGKNYWPEAELVDPSGAIHNGRSAIAQSHVDLWNGIFKGTRQKATVRRIQVLCPNSIIVDFDAELSGMKALPPGSPADVNGVLRVHLKHILEKRNGVWKVLSAQNTFAASATAK